MAFDVGRAFIQIGRFGLPRQLVCEALQSIQQRIPLLHFLALHAIFTFSKSQLHEYAVSFSLAILLRNGSDMNAKFGRGLFIFTAIAWAIPLFAMGSGCMGIVRECNGWYVFGTGLACLFTMPFWLSAITVKSISIIAKFQRIACLLLLLAVIFVCGRFVYELDILSFPFRVNYFGTSDVLMNVVFFIHPFLISVPASLGLASMVYADLHLDRFVLPIPVSFAKIIKSLAFAAPLSSLLYFSNIVLPELYVRFFRPDQGSFLSGVYAPMYDCPLGFIGGGKNGIYVAVSIYFAGTFFSLWMLNSGLEYWKKK